MQGAATMYVVPLLIIANEETTFCSTLSVKAQTLGTSHTYIGYNGFFSVFDDE